MSLLDLWERSPDELLSKRLWQVVAIAGSGKLTDSGDTSAQFREFLSRIPFGALCRWAQDAAQGKFEGSGFALQDVVNEVGRRLGFTVRPGTYRGGGGEPYDGLWESRAGHSIVVETKTSDNFSIDLNKLAEYRRRLVSSEKLGEEASSILLVLGRQDTGDYEDRIKGSRYAFVMRFITVDALLRLLALKEATTDEYASGNLSTKIFELFTSPKFIGLDPVVDLVAAAPLLPVPTDRYGERAGTGGDHKNAVDGKMAEAVFNMVRTAGPSGVKRRNLQRRFPRAGALKFGEVLDSLTGSLRLRVEKRGRKIFVMLGEDAFKDEVLLALADLYEKNKLNQGLCIRDYAMERGFPQRLADRVVAELRAEGAIVDAGRSGDFCFTDSGYQKHLPQVRVLRGMAGGT